MRAHCRLASVVALTLPMLLSGCFLLRTTRRLPIPKPPAIVQTVAAEELVERLNHRWAGLQSMYAKVDVQFTESDSKQGLAKDFTSFPAIIMMRKPELLRVFGRVPVLGSPLFDMASDGKVFTLYVPSQNKVYKGSNVLNKKSANQYENMRPKIFFDAMVVRGLEPDDEYMVTSDTPTVVDPDDKHLDLVPEYKLSIMRRRTDSHELTPVRVVYFHREDLLPYQQDVYDNQGNLETQVFYSEYQEFDTGKYPSKVTILCPLEEYTVKLTVSAVKENMPLKDDQFQITYPEETPVHRLE